MRRKSEDELLSAYVDGVAELSLEERRRIDDLMARDPAVRADEVATRDLIDRLRELPPEGGEPDWSALERSIGAAVGQSVPNVPWWRRSQNWIAPAVAVATSAVLAAIILRDPPPAAAPRGTAAVAPAPVAPVADELAALPLWLDGDATEIDLEGEPLDDFSAVLDLYGADLEVEPDGLLDSDIAWIDELDDRALERAASWLERARPAPARGDRS